MSRQPNILLLMSDQHRADAMGCAGSSVVRTPGLDRLAADGVRFTDAICTSPLCMPSRASLTTGLYAHNHGLLDNDSGSLLPYAPTFMRALQQAGYHTAGIGKFHYFLHGGISDLDELHERMLGYGFDEILETEGKEMSEVHAGPWTRYLAQHGLEDVHRADFRTRRKEHPPWYAGPSPLGEEHHHDAFIGREAVRWLDAYQDERPFFLWVGWVGPHLPWDAPGRYATLYDPAEFPVPPLEDLSDAPVAVRRRVEQFGLDRASLDDLRRMMAAYYGLVSHVDSWVGAILDALDRRGGRDNTLVIYTTDHGEMLAEHGLIQKSVFYEGAVRVPLIVRYPERFAPGVADAPVELVDLTPTLLEYGDAEPLPTCEGRSLTPLLQQPDSVPEGWRDAVFSELRGEFMIRTERYTYVYRVSETRQELFDRIADPAQLRNLSGAPAASEVEHQLRERLFGWLAATNRPLTSRDLQPGVLDAYRTVEAPPLRT
ncbi:MAG: sulfatase-like hydrolase/transferase [Chloroflexi bacterium]|nr:sulfatase-like hydrolase/transferase [Chloroflexota bacterium]